MVTTKPSPTRSNLKDVEQRFDRYVVRMRSQGQLMLPAERILSEELGCSRVLVRKLLDRKDSEGLLVKNHLGRTLSVEAAANRTRIGQLTFVAEGAEIVANPAWNRLWHRLQVHAAAVNLSSRLALYPYRHDGLDWAARLDGEVGFLVTPTLSANLSRYLATRPDIVSVVTDEHPPGTTGSMVCLDNHAAGRMAAEQLALRGYRRPALICARHIVAGQLYVTFERRCAGFREACARLGLEFSEDSEFWIGPPGVRSKIELMQAAVELGRRGFDAVFLHTDNDYDFLYEGFADARKLIPEDIGVITVNSQGRAENASPRIVAISHASDAIARALVGRIHGLLRSGRSGEAIGEHRIEPSVHDGLSLRPLRSQP